MVFLVDGIVVDVMDIITTHSHVTYEQEGNWSLKLLLETEIILNLNKFYDVFVKLIFVFEVYTLYHDQITY